MAIILERPSARQIKFKDEFKYIDLRYAYANDQHSVVIIYDNLTSNEEIDKNLKLPFRFLY